jgi:hypothetical protein
MTMERELQPIHYLFCPSPTRLLRWSPHIHTHLLLFHTLDPLDPGPTVPATGPCVRALIDSSISPVDPLQKYLVDIDGLDDTAGFSGSEVTMV